MTTTFPSYRGWKLWGHRYRHIHRNSHRHRHPLKMQSYWLSKALATFGLQSICRCSSIRIRIGIRIEGQSFPTSAPAGGARATTNSALSPLHLSKTQDTKVGGMQRRRLRRNLLGTWQFASHNEVPGSCVPRIASGSGNFGEVSGTGNWKLVTGNWMCWGFCRAANHSCRQNCRRSAGPKAPLFSRVIGIFVSKQCRQSNRRNRSDLFLSPICFYLD